MGMLSKARAFENTCSLSMESPSITAEEEACAIMDVATSRGVEVAPACSNVTEDGRYISGNPFEMVSHLQVPVYRSDHP